MENFREKVEELLGVDLDDLNINETGEFLAVWNNIKYKINIKTEEIISLEDTGFKELSDKNKETFKERVQRVLGIDLDMTPVDTRKEFVCMREEIMYKVNIETEVIEILPELTFGQRAVGITYLPSGEEGVIKAKQLSAELIDLVEQKMLFHKLSPNVSWTTNVFRTAAFNAVIAAQMAVVKFLTYRD